MADMVDRELDWFVKTTKETGFKVTPGAVGELRGLIQTGLETVGATKNVTPYHGKSQEYDDAVETLRRAIIHQAVTASTFTISPVHVSSAIAILGWRFWPFTGGK